MSIPTPQSNSGLTVLRLNDRGLQVLASNADRQVMRGPGAFVRKGANKIGGALEGMVNWIDQAMNAGPECAAEEVKSLLCSDENRVRKLDELYHWRIGSETPSKPHNSTVKELRKLCKTVVKYTHGYPPETQLIAFKIIVMLTTRFIGLRWMFSELLASKMRPTALDASTLSRFWTTSDSHDGSELYFYLKYAVFCITASTDHDISAVEECPPSHFGLSHRVRCVSEALIQSISSNDAQELSKLAAARYLAGILELPTFWSQRINNGPLLQENSVCDRHPPEIICQYPHSLVDGICKIGVKLLEDIDMNGKAHLTSEDLIPLDTEGIGLLLDAYWLRLPGALQSLTDNDDRTKESLRLVDKLGSLLQGDRSKSLFPDASTAARGVLESIRKDKAQDSQAAPGLFDDPLNLDNSIGSLQETVSRTPDSHPRKPHLLADLGRIRRMRFGRFGDLADLENSIVSLQEAVALTPDGHPDKPDRLSNLGAVYSTRFERLGDIVDLQNSVASFQQSVALTPDGHPDKPDRLSNLGAVYFMRFERLGDIVDLQNSVASFQQSVTLTPDGHPTKAAYLSNLGAGYRARFERLGELADLENSVTSFQQAVALIPDGHTDKPGFLSNLGADYFARFERLRDLADLENAIASSQQAVALTREGHLTKAAYLSNLGAGYRMRFERLGELADLENSVASFQQSVTLTPDGYPNKPDRLSSIGAGYRARFERLGELADLENSIASLQQAVALTPDGLPEKAVPLSNLSNGYLARFERLGDLADLENSIASSQQAVARTPEDHPDIASRLSLLNAGYRARFERLGDLADLENSIVISEQVVALTPDGHPDKPSLLSKLVDIKQRRSELKKPGTQAM